MYAPLFKKDVGGVYPKSLALYGPTASHFCIAVLTAFSESNSNVNEICP